MPEVGICWEGVENKAAKVDYDQSAEINLSIEDVKNNLKENLSIEDVSNELEENFEFGSLEDEELEDSADESMKTGEDMVDLEEIFTAADSVEKADNDSIENITDGTNTKESKDGSGEEAVEGEDGSANDVGGTAIFDSIDLVRQAVEFLTVSKWAVSSKTNFTFPSLKISESQHPLKVLRNDNNNSKRSDK